MGPKVEQITRQVFIAIITCKGQYAPLLELKTTLHRCVLSFINYHLSSICLLYIPHKSVHVV